MPEKLIVSANEDGLGNRMKCWVNTQAKDNSAKLVWPVNATINCDFSELFIDNGFLIETLPAEAEKCTNWRLTEFPKHLLPENFANYRGHSYTDGRAIDFEYNRIPDEIKKLFIPFFARIAPVSEVVKKVDEISQSFDSETVSVHVRTWIDAPNRAYKYSIKEYFKFMDKFTSSKFFVACDSPLELEKFKARYPHRIISCPVSAKPDNVEKFQHALAEMYLLSKNQVIITSYASTFSEVAWWLGGAEAEIHIVPNKEMNIGVDEARGLKYLIHRFKNKLKRPR